MARKKSRTLTQGPFVEQAQERAKPSWWPEWLPQLDMDNWEDWLEQVRKVLDERMRK